MAWRSLHLVSPTSSQAEYVFTWQNITVASEYGLGDLIPDEICGDLDSAEPELVAKFVALGSELRIDSDQGICILRFSTRVDQGMKL